MDNDDSMNIRLPAEMKALAIEVAAEADFKSLGTYIRALLWEQIRDARPEDFKRLRGVG